jgi:hypothetical protein
MAIKQNMCCACHQQQQEEEEEEEEEEDGCQINEAHYGRWKLRWRLWALKTKTSEGF